MNVAQKTFAGVISVLALFLAVMIFPGPFLTPRAYLDYRRCLGIEKGMAEAQVLERMGPPLERRGMGDGEEWLYYRSVARTSGPVVVVLVGESGEKHVEYAACDGTG